MRLSIRCFGELEIAIDGERFPAQRLGGARARRLFKVLLTHPDRFLTKDQLIDWLWDDERLPENPERALRNYVYQLRKALKPETGAFQLIRTGDDGGYGFFANGFAWIDTAAFEAGLERAEALLNEECWAEAVAPLQEAVALRRGEFFPEDRYGDWATARRDELDRKYVWALSQLAECHAQLKQWAQAIECAQRAASQAPGHEGVHRRLMRYSCWSGNRDRALQTFDRLKAYLDAELDVAPESATAALHDRIQRGLLLPPDEVEPPSPATRARGKTSTAAPASDQGKRVDGRWIVGGIFILGFLTVALIRMFYGGSSPVGDVTVRFFDRTGPFLEAGGFPPVMVDFDELEPGTDLTGKTLNGVRFDRPRASGAPLLVARGAETFTPEVGFRCEPRGDRETHKLLPTTGANVLSPGGPELAPGPNPALEDDDLVLTFEQPVSAVGLDVLWQTAQGQERTVTLRDPQGDVLLTQPVQLSLGTPGVARPGGAKFVGFVAAEDVIAQVIVDEADDDNCLENSNAGYDTIWYKREGPAPSSVERYAFVRQWGGQAGSNPGEFNGDLGPRGLALVEEGGETFVYVSDYVNKRVQVFDAAGRFVAAHPLPGTPQDIEYDGEGAFYARLIDEADRGQVVKLDARFDVLWSHAVPAAQWVSYGLCVDRDGNVHVPSAASSVPADHHMRKLSPAGELLLEYGAGLVKGSSSCEADEQGFVYAVDTVFSNLRKFDLEGGLVDTIEVGGGVRALALDREGAFFLARELGGNPQVFKYDASFEPLASWGGTGEGTGTFSHKLLDLEVDARGRVYVADGKNYLVQVFEPR